MKYITPALFRKTVCTAVAPGAIVHETEWHDGTGSRAYKTVRLYFLREVSKNVFITHTGGISVLTALVDFEYQEEVTMELRGRITRALIDAALAMDALAKLHA